MRLLPRQRLGKIIGIVLIVVLLMITFIVLSALRTSPTNSMPAEQTAIIQALRWVKNHWFNSPAATAWATIVLALATFLLVWATLYASKRERPNRNDPAIPSERHVASTGPEVPSTAHRASIGSSGKPAGGNEGQVGAGVADLPHTSISDRDAHDLGVHPAVWPGDSREAPTLTPYLRREHDVKLDNLIERAASGGPSVFAVLVGGSATGKTRALFEAFNRHPKVREWPLYYPADARELAALVMQDRIGPSSVLWLNETQRYLYGESGPDAAKLLARLVADTSRTLVVGAMWPEYWLDLTRTGAVGDPNAAARELLDRPERRIDVVDHLEKPEIVELAAVGGDDKRVAAAVAAAGTGGQVIQNLTAGPELLARYIDGSLFSPTERALVTAALDARRLGHQSPFSSRLLIGAADGYVNDRQRPDRQGWLSTLTALAGGERTDAHGTATAVRTLTALTTHRIRGQADPDYEPSDFLDQHTRPLRQECRGPTALWEALVNETADPRDLYRLGDAAESRGLDRHAAQLWLRATADGDVSSAVRLAWVIARTDDQQMLHDAADWIASHADLAQPSAGGQILDTFHRTGVGQQLSIVAQRIAATANISDPRAVDYLIRRLRQVGADDQLIVLARRVSDNADVTDPRIASYLIGRLQEAGLGDQLTQLVNRAAMCSDLRNPQSVGSLIRQLREASQDNALNLLLQRDPAGHADLDNPRAVSVLIDALRECGSATQLNALGRRAAAHANLADSTIVYLIDALARTGLSDQLIEIIHRAAAEASAIDPATLGYIIGRTRSAVPHDETMVLAAQAAAHARLVNPLAVSVLISALHKSGVNDQVSVLADRAVTGSDLTDPRATSYLIDALVIAGADDKVAALAHRAVIDCDPMDPQAVSHLIRSLRDTRSGGHIAVLAERAAAHTDLANPSGVGRLIEQLRESGAGVQLAALSTRLTASAELSNPWAIAYLIEALLRVNADYQLTRLLALDPAAKADLSDPSAVARLLKALDAANADIQLASLSRRAAMRADISSPHAVGDLIGALLHTGMHEQVTVLLSRDPAAHVELDDAQGAGMLMDVLRQLPDRTPLVALADRIAEYADVSDPNDAAQLVGALARADAPEDLASFSRRVAERTDLTNPSAVTTLIAAFRNVGRNESARQLAARAADAGVEMAFRTLVELYPKSPKTELMRLYGREPDAQPPKPWSWEDLTRLTMRDYDPQSQP